LKSNGTGRTEGDANTKSYEGGPGVHFRGTKGSGEELEELYDGIRRWRGEVYYLTPERADEVAAAFLERLQNRKRGDGGLP
jgi:hypothetical protein